MTTFAAYDLDGAPLAGLAPTWHVVYAVGVGAIPDPTIADVGDGLYLIADDFTADATGIIDLGATASPRYLHIGATDYHFFAAYGEDLAPLAGLVPVWVSYVDAAGVPIVAPEIDEQGFGTYSIGLTGDPPSDGESGIIDLGATASPRYLAWSAPEIEVVAEPGPPVLSSLDTERGGVGFVLRTTRARI